MVLAAWNQCLFLRDLTEGGTLRWWLMCRLLFTHGELRGFYALFLWLLVSGQLMSPKRVWTYTPFHVLKVVWRPHRPHSVFVKAFKFSFRSAVRFKLKSLELVQEISLDQAPGKWKLHRKGHFGHGGHAPSEIFILKNNNHCNWQTSTIII